MQDGTGDATDTQLVADPKAIMSAADDELESSQGSAESGQVDDNPDIIPDEVNISL